MHSEHLSRPVKEKMCAHAILIYTVRNALWSDGSGCINPRMLHVPKYVEIHSYRTFAVHLYSVFCVFSQKTGIPADT